MVGLGVVTTTVHSWLPFGTLHCVGHLPRATVIEAQNPADRVACERRHRNHRGLHLVVLLDLRGLTRRAIQPRTGGSDVAGGDRARSHQRHRRGVLFRHLRDLHGVGHLMASGAFEARNPVDEVACGRRHRNHHGRHLVVLFGIRRTTRSIDRGSDASQRRRRRRSDWISSSSSSWCAPGSSPGTAPHRPRGAYRDV
jgi:hypothetical protein